MLRHWCKSLFADELWIVIQPHEILLQRVSRRLSARSKPQVFSTKRIECAHKLLEKNTDETDWAILARYLRQALNEPMCQSAVPRLVLSNHFVRYAVIPWNNELSTQDERLVYTKHSFTQAFGENVKGWDLRMSQSAYGQSTIASAIDRTLLNTIHSVFDELSMPLQAIYPHLMLTINHTFMEINNKKLSYNTMSDFWIVTIQNQRLCIALHDQSGWRLVKSLTAELDVMRQIKMLIHREIMNGNLQEDLPVFVYAPDANQSKAIKSLDAPFMHISSCHVDMQNNLPPKRAQDWALA